MAGLVPVNKLEIELRKVVTDKKTPLWNFYTPLATAPLWLIAKHHPELVGSDLVAPAGQPPEICVLNHKDDSWVGLYTAPERANTAMELLKIPASQWTVISAPGHQILRSLKDGEPCLCMNLGLTEWQYNLDNDMVEILLSRPLPETATRQTTFDPEGNPAQYLTPVREFLAQQPNVRAAWITSPTPEAPLPAGQRAYELGLVMRDPEDDSLLEKVRVMAKALTPIEMEWATGVMMADENSLRILAENHLPFYRAPDFLKPPLALPAS